MLMRRLVLLNCGFVLLTMLIVVAVAALSWSDGELSPQVAGNLPQLLVLLLFVVIGTLIATRRPDNLIGIVLCLVATAASVLTLTEAYLEYDLFEYDGELPGVRVAAWFNSWLWVWILMPPVTLLLLIAPDGRLPSPRWRKVLYLLAIIAVLSTLTSMFKAGPIESYEAIENPFGIAAIDPVIDLLEFLGFILLLPAIGLSGAALVHRFRRSEGRERLQLKWLATAAVAALAIFVASWPISILGFDVWGYTPLFAACLLPIALGIAILRHQLYDIDRIINRTLVYVPLTAILAGFFVAVTGLIRAVFTNLTDAGSDAATAVSTLAVVALLTPLKNQLQAFVDRHFKEQHNPQKALNELIADARSISRVLDRDAFINNVLEEITAAFNLVGASVEIFDSNGSAPRSFGATGDTPTLSVPLLYHDRRLGELSIWLRPDVATDETNLKQAFERPADAIARVIALPWPEASTYADHAFRT